MGAIATVLDGGGSKFKPSFIVDFEICQPNTDEERVLYDIADAILIKKP